MSQTGTESTPISSAGSPAQGAKSGDQAASPQKANQTLAERLLGAYKQMLISLFSATLAIIAAIALLTLLPYAKSGTGPSILVLVVLAGCLGAFFSALIRLYNFQDLPKALVAPDFPALSSGHLFVYSLVPAVVGAISATVLYLVFAAGFLAGPLVPSFICKTQSGADCQSFGGFMYEYGPTAAVDYAKILVWGFIAGFAERLVPDTLQNLSTSVHLTKDKDASAADVQAADTKDKPKRNQNQEPTIS